MVGAAQEILESRVRAWAGCWRWASPRSIVMGPKAPWARPSRGRRDSLRSQHPQHDVSGVLNLRCFCIPRPKRNSFSMLLLRQCIQCPLCLWTLGPPHPPSSLPCWGPGIVRWGMAGAGRSRLPPLRAWLEERRAMTSRTSPPQGSRMSASERTPALSRSVAPHTWLVHARDRASPDQEGLRAESLGRNECRVPYSQF